MEDADIPDNIGNCCAVNSATAQGRRIRMVQMVLVPLIPVLALCASSGARVYDSTWAYFQVNSLVERVVASVETVRLVQKFEAEREQRAFYIR